MTARKSRHHHGNLRATLVAAGVVLVDRSGPDALSTRKLAAQAGSLTPRRRIISRP
ncbi:MAG: hypothetical protein JKP98_00110 [Rhodobacteraceae bacterium]|nr:hypothetical protein [Paracoccaceae bacterium]